MDAIPLGGFITLAVLLPNLLAVFFPPASKPAGDPSVGDTRLRVMTVIERIGQIGTFVIPFFYRLKFDSTINAAAIAIMIGALAFYYAGWIRYLVRGRAEELFFRPMLGIPLPMAVMPVIYFFSASILLGSIWLAFASAVLGVGHISVSWSHSRSISA